MRLEKRQLYLLRAKASGSALVVATPVSRRLCDLGLMHAHGEDGSFAAITPAGLRALADAVETGRVEMFRIPTPAGEEG